MPTSSKTPRKRVQAALHKAAKAAKKTKPREELLKRSRKKLKSESSAALDPLYLRPTRRENRPIYAKKLWPWLPHWMALHAERSGPEKCWFGHRLMRDTANSKEWPTCTYCEKEPPKKSQVHVCRKCYWVVCGKCKLRPKLPPLEVDPFFHGPHSPCLLPAHNAVSSQSRGTVIICPGGNYEFLVPGEGIPVANMLAEHGIRAFVLRYRILPRYGLEESLDDLLEAIKIVKRLHGGPVSAMGFSAGGHLVGCHSLRQSASSIKVDSQVLMYPCIDGLDWGDKETCAFSNFDHTFPNPKAQSLLYGRQALMGGAGFAAPPTFLVASTADQTAPPKEHSDLYAKALRANKVECKYLRRDFGSHGFGLAGGWTDQCAKWLQSKGFGCA